MRGKVGIIGMGWVGSSVAISSLHAGVAGELLLNDIRGEIAEGDAMDLAHGAMFYPSARVRTAGVEEMVDCDAVVISAGRGGGPEESRLDLLRDNARLVREVGRKLSGCSGVIIMVTNPVDVLTKVLTDASGLPPSRVIGTGTMLDTARLRQVLSERINVNPRSIHAQVVGEHGDSEVVLWSSASVGGTPLRAWEKWDEAIEDEVAETVRKAAYEIIHRKGATNHAIGLVTADLLKSITRSERRLLTVTRVQEEVLELDDVALSLPAVVSDRGATHVVRPEMDEAEHAALMRSVDVLRSAAASIDGG
ncbi:MAG: L-lactate dehydrogenase [Rhodothermales bacterium]